MTTHFLKIIAASLVLSSPLSAQTAHVPEGFENFEAYEIAMFQRIDELAVQRGANAIQIGQIHQLRDELREQYAEAQLQNNRAEMAKAQALQAHVIRGFLEELGN